MEDWALIRRLAAEGVPKKQIAERLRISRTTVVKAVASTAPPKYERRRAATSFAPFEDRVRVLLAEHPEMPATVIAERVGWSGSITWFRDNVRRLRPEHQRPDPADRLVWAAGDAAQCDLWFPPRRIPLEDGTDERSERQAVERPNGQGRHGVRTRRGQSCADACSIADYSAPVEATQREQYLRPLARS